MKHLAKIKEILYNKMELNKPVIIVGEEFQVKGKIQKIDKDNVEVNMGFDLLSIPRKKITSAY